MRGKGKCCDYIIISKIKENAVRYSGNPNVFGGEHAQEVASINSRVKDEGQR